MSRRMHKLDWAALAVGVALFVLGLSARARGQSLADCPALDGPCASYSWEDSLVAASGESRLKEYLRILGHVSLHAHYESQAALLARVDKLRPGLPVCLCLSPYGPAVEPDNWTDPATGTLHKKRPPWAADAKTVLAVQDFQAILSRWAARLQGRDVTLLVDFERWTLDGDSDQRSAAALGDRWRFLLASIDQNFPAARLVIYGYRDHWFQASQNTSSAIFGYWKPTQYWPADLQARSEPGPVCYYGATAEGRAWTALRLSRLRNADPRPPWAHVQLVGQWPVGGSYRKGVAWADAEMVALGSTLRAANAVPVFWGSIGSDAFDSQLPLFVEGFNP